MSRQFKNFLGFNTRFLNLSWFSYFLSASICEGGVGLSIDHNESGNPERVKVKGRVKAVPPQPLCTGHSDKASLLLK